MPIRSLITGATGFVGSHLVASLVEAGQQVRCLVRETSDLRWLEGLPIALVQGSLQPAEGLEEAVRGVNRVYHLAGVVRAPRPADFFAANHLGTQALIQACLRVNPDLDRFLYLSSLAAAGPSVDGRPVTEADPPRPITAYGASKLRGEEEVLAVADRIPVTILRPPVIYGPRDRAVLVYFRLVKRGIKPLLGFRRRVVDIMHVDDVIQAIIGAADAPEAVGEQYFLAGPSRHSWEEIAEAIARGLQVRAVTVRIPEAILPLMVPVTWFWGRVTGKGAVLHREKLRDLKVRAWTCDASKLAEDLGMTPRVSLAKGVAATAEWYLREGWL